MSLPELNRKVTESSNFLTLIFLWVRRDYVKLLSLCDIHSLREGPVGLSAQLPVLSPVRHVTPDRELALLSEHLLDQVCRRHVHNHQWTVLGLPQRAIDLFVLNLIGETHGYNEFKAIFTQFAVLLLD